MDKNKGSSTGEVKWTPAESPRRDAGPKYSRISEHFRHVTPGAIQCSMFCGGKQCKYENPAKMKSEEMAINGLYSSWVTPDILATARPSTEVVKKFDIIGQFSQTGIKSLINLQHPGEHSSCGFGIEPVSGFSYVPEDFMKEDIFFYNFGWNDYGVRSLESILDMVKVMSFALKEGKAAVHCHAGLGRTGVLIACYLVFSERIGAEEAIHRVRSNRPKAVQTRGQIQCVVDFTNFVHHLWVVYSSCASSAKPFTLQQYLKRQRLVLHGMEARLLKHVPKLVYVCCSRLLEVAGVKGENDPLTWALSQEVKAVFAEVDESDISKDGESENGRDWLHTSLSENVAHSLRHNPYVDSSLPPFESSQVHHTESCDVFEEDTVKEDHFELYGEGKLDDRLLQHPNIGAPLRHGSEPVAIHSSPRTFHHVKLEPLNLSSRKKSKMKKKKVKKTQGEGSEASGNNTVTSDVSSLLPSSKQSERLSTGNDRIQVAKSLASSACADSSVHSRTERIKRKLNNSDSWEEIHTESDPWVLTRLLWAWLGSLVEPVLSEKEVSLLEENIDDPVEAVKKLQRGDRDTLECLVTTICELEPLPEEVGDRVLRQTAMILTQDKKLSLTQPRAVLNRSVELSSPDDAENALGREQEVVDIPEPELYSLSYRLLLFLRQLVETLKCLAGILPK